MPVTEREQGGQAENGELSASQRKYGKLIGESASIILDEQHSTTGLYPAATRERFVGRDHYDHAWVRDSSAIAIAFLDPMLLGILPPDSRIKEKVIESGMKFVKGMLEISSSEPWKSAFSQGSIPAGDSNCKRRVLAKEAPPIHLKIDGSQCVWPTQNQPDSWGEFLISLGLSLKQGLLTADEKQQDAIDSITKYLLNIRVPDLEQFAMWEWAQGSASLSSVAIVAKGLDMIMPYVSPEVRVNLGDEVDKSRKFVEAIYPADYTVCYGHGGRTDLATFVAHGFGALEGLSLDRFLEEADVELGNGQHPGKKRFIGDHYYRADEEAIWPIGALLEAKIFLEKSINSFRSKDYDEGRKFQTRGLTCLEKIINLQNQHGYIPELLEQRGGKLIPNNNSLLWNRAVLIQACAAATVSESFDSAKLN